MKPLPLPLRVAAGLAVTTAERARELPKQVAGLPVTVASQVLQFSMRVQQHITELAIKGDDALSTLRPVEDSPSWATFDEDLDDLPEGPDDDDLSRFDNVTRLGVSTEFDAPEPGPPTVNGTKPGDEAPWEQEERALADLSDEDLDNDDAAEPDPEGVVGPAGLATYDELTLPQLRARLRQFSVEQLEELLAYERANANRPSFVGMLARRIGNVRRENGDTTTDSDTDTGAGGR